MSKNEPYTPITPDIEYWWIRRNGSLTIAEVFRYKDLILEVLVTGVEGPVDISSRDLVARIQKPTIIVLN